MTTATLERPKHEESSVHIRRPTRKRIIGLALAILVAVYLAIVGLVGVRIRTDLVRARKEIHLAQDAAVRSDITRAQLHARAAKALTKAARRDSRGIVIGPLSHAPAIGEQVTGLKRMTEAADDTLDVVENMLRIAQDTPALSSKSVPLLSSPDVRQLLSELEPSVPALKAAATRLAKARRLVTGTSPHLVPQLRSAKRELLNELERAENRVQIALGLHAFATRAVQPQPLRLLLLSQDTWELRPTGGYIGSYGILEIRSGKVHLVKYDDATTLPYPKPQNQLHPTEPLSSYLTHPWSLTGAGWWPDFPRSAKAAQDLYVAQGGTNVDGVIAVTQTFLEDLLRGLGPVRVPGYPDRITADNVAERILYHVELKHPLDKPRKKFLTELTATLFDKLEHFDGKQSRHVVTALARAFKARHAQIFFNDPELNKPFALAGWDGAMKPPSNNTDFLSVADADFGTDKSTRWVKKSIRYRVFWNKNQKPEAEVTIDINDFGAKSKINPFYTSFLRVYTLPDAKFYPATRTETTTKIGEESGLQTLGFHQVTEPQSTTTLTFHFDLPTTVTKDGLYRLLLRPQAGTPGDRYEVTIELGTKRITRSFGGDAGDQIITAAATPPSARGSWLARTWRTWRGSLRR